MVRFADKWILLLTTCLIYGCQNQTSVAKTAVVTEKNTSLHDHDLTVRHSDLKGTDDQSLAHIVDTCVASLEDLSSQDEGIVAPNETVIAEVQEAIFLKQSSDALAEIIDSGEKSPLPYESIISARHLIREKWVSLGWVSGDRLLGKLQEHLGRSSGYYILGLSDNIKGHVEENQHLVCGVVLHEIKHLDQLLLALIDGELTPHTYLSDDRIKELEKEAYALEDGYLRLWGLTRQHWKLGKQAVGSVISTVATSVPPAGAIMHADLAVKSASMSKTSVPDGGTDGGIRGIVEGWADNDRYKERVQEFANALSNIRIVNTADLGGNTVFDFVLGDDEGSAPILLIDSAAFMQLTADQRQATVVQMADDWYALQ